MADSLYTPDNFIRQVSGNNIIFQDISGVSSLTLDYTIFGSAIPSGKTLNITEDDNNNSTPQKLIKLIFSSDSKALDALTILMTTITQLRKGTYISPPNVVSNSVSYTVDYSEIYLSSNFIQGVSNNLIRIQNKDASELIYSINYNDVKTTLVDNRFLIIYQKDKPTISLQFSTNSDALKAHDILRDTIDQLKDNTYNTINNQVGNALYDPNTFIYLIRYEDYSVQIVNINGVITHTIVAEPVISVYTSTNLVKVKSEGTDTIIKLAFSDSNNAIIAAEKLRLAIKEITDKLPNLDIGDGLKSYSEDFNSDVWVLEPDVAFSLTSFSLEYFELVCPTGGASCSVEDKVKRSCKGLVEYEGSYETDMLKSITISFNQIVEGRAILISK